MKRIVTSILMAVGITGTFVAQAAAQGRMVADVPFAFSVYNSTMPAGQYEVTRESVSGVAVFALHCKGGQNILMQLGIMEQGNPEKPSLTFLGYGNERVLAKITPAGSPVAYAFSASSIEKRLHHKVGMASMISVKLAAR